jgi:hypothetical protein
MSTPQGRLKRPKSLQSIKDKRQVSEPTLPKAIITLTEAPGNPNAYTIGLGLHGAHMEALHPGEDHPVSIVDVIALAAANVINTQPQDFQDAVALVASTLRRVNDQIAGGADEDEALAEADETLGGAISSVDA